MGQNALGGLGLDAAGVHQQKLVAVPLAVGKNAVAGNARGILHNGKALAAQLIEQGGFARAGKTDDGDEFALVNRKAHAAPGLEGRLARAVALADVDEFN